MRNFVKVFKRIRAPRQMPSSIRRLVTPQLKTDNVGIGNTFRCILPGVTSTNHESPSTNHANFAILPASEKQEKKQA